MMIEPTLDLNRKIVISQMIDDDIAGEVVAQILDINDYDDQMSQVKSYEPQPIEIFINSGGGSATAGFAIIGAMEMSETPIITYGLGAVGSMALAVFVSGDVRIVHRNCRMLYHSVAYGADGFLRDHEESYKEANLIQEMYDAVFLDNTKMTKEMMKDIKEKKHNFFFSSEKAIELGIAHEVISKTKK